jgi:hypothetical protein
VFSSSSSASTCYSLSTSCQLEAIGAKPSSLLKSLHSLRSARIFGPQLSPRLPADLDWSFTRGDIFHQTALKHMLHHGASIFGSDTDILYIKYECIIV